MVGDQERQGKWVMVGWKFGTATYFDLFGNSGQPPISTYLRAPGRRSREIPGNAEGRPILDSRVRGNDGRGLVDSPAVSNSNHCRAASLANRRRAWQHPASFGGALQGSR
jgi:hypothetical protein